jgi:hypothetical protein
VPTPADRHPVRPMLIVGRVHARLLRLPLLDIDVDVAIGPPDALPPTVSPPRMAGRRRRWTGVHRRAPSVPATAELDRRSEGPRSDGAGLALARSAQLVEEATTVLDEVDGH